jgi:hypothetical protein
VALAKARELRFKLTLAKVAAENPRGSIGGAITVQSPLGAGTLLYAELPLEVRQTSV